MLSFLLFSDFYSDSCVASSRLLKRRFCVGAIMHISGRTREENLAVGVDWRGQGRLLGRLGVYRPFFLLFTLLDCQN